MILSGICIITNDVLRLAAFYETILKEKPVIEGSHYSFGNLAIDSGEIASSQDRNIWLQFFDEDIDVLYGRLLKEIPDIKIVSPPERKPWGAYSFWILDPDGNKIAVAQI